MTTDLTPPTNEPLSGDVDQKTEQRRPSNALSTEEIIRRAEISGESKEGRRMKFIPQVRDGKTSAIVMGVLAGSIVIILLVVLLTGSRDKSAINTLSSEGNEQSEVKNNNSAGYLQSPAGDFGSYSLDLSASQPELLKSSNLEGNIGQQINWEDGFTILAAKLERDYRPASEFSYKKIAESGDEIVRVNFLVGNATNAVMPIGYSDLALYAQTQDGTRIDAERISEDVYSPTDGQTLGGKQARKLSLHYRVQRGSNIVVVKSKTYTQNKAVVKKGQEKNPVVNMKINLM